MDIFALYITIDHFVFPYPLELNDPAVGGKRISKGKGTVPFGYFKGLGR